MDIKITKQEDCVIIAIEGRIDTITAKDFEASVMETLDGECLNIIVDCEKLSYISSSGLRVFLILQKGINAKNGKLVLRSMNDSIKEIFKITGFASIFTIE